MTFMHRFDSLVKVHHRIDPLIITVIFIILIFYFIVNTLPMIVPPQICAGHVMFLLFYLASLVRNTADPRQEMDMNQSGDAPDGPGQSVQRSVAALPSSGDTMNCIPGVQRPVGRATDAVPRLGVHTEREQELGQVRFDRRPVGRG